MPATIPGKNPAATATPGIAGQSSDVDSLRLGIGRGVAEMVVIAGGEVDVGSGVVIDVEDAVFEGVVSTLQLPLSHTYPWGQHPLPHCERGSRSFVVLTTLEGSLDTFCRCISQVIGLIVVQSLPLGQQTRVVELSRLRQVEDLGQQKLDGSFSSGHLDKFGSAQDSVSRGKISKARPDIDAQ
ncbi:hypothetical protein CPC735_020310 [Coccidioides posadasii C735 delta SOWgp]|uniref:Uncharacterized protein n=2 Tax=Coccidioides posadasii TaxID=199306 RepID=C5PJ54_COCP7|nr:hypothetical protein CPC735_020310 [Coccidioides posadasii C735 delta SOWgp]EER23003.1 hypothetical protein CPC735_020310 [Coccidioides posadasii C735 delta SOWgp]|eukprot:XP_003065148.1 hypothetical protein CPC735_020310 [Coccidioides posadasii C735 delta SOWgp]